MDNPVDELRSNILAAIEISRVDGAVSYAEAIGVLEIVKHEIIEEMNSEED